LKRSRKRLLKRTKEVITEGGKQRAAGAMVGGFLFAQGRRKNRSKEIFRRKGREDKSGRDASRGGLVSISLAGGGGYVLQKREGGKKKIARRVSEKKEGTLPKKKGQQRDSIFRRRRT